MNLFRNYIIDILRLTSIMLVSIFMLGTIVYAASTWPISGPSGETVGGKFMLYLNNIKGDCPSGKVLVGFNSDLTKKCGSN